MLAVGLDPNVRDDDGDTALHLAVSAESLAAVEALLARGANAEVADFRGDTPLTRALREDRRSIAETLQRAGAVLQEPTDLVELFEEAADAVVDGNVAKLTALLDREPRLVHARSVREHRATLLHYTGANGTEPERQRTPPNAPAIVELLLARGSDPDAFAMFYGGGPGHTTLALAVTSGFPDEAGVMPDLVRALTRGGARVDGPNGEPSLEYALPSAWPALVEAGAAIDLVGAAQLGLIDRVRAYLTLDGALQPGARVGPPKPAQQIKDDAFLAACCAKQTAVAAYLLDAGARIDTADSERMTGLHHAVWRCDHATARMLIDRGAPLEAKNAYGGTVLDFLVWVLDHEKPKKGPAWRSLVDLLLDAGADPEAAGGRDAIEAALR
jgi:ankyrin repeat protein